MQFSKSTLLLGEGRLSGAVEKSDGAIRFFIDRGGAVVERTMVAGRRGISKETFVSYADDYTETMTAAVSRYGNEARVR